MIATAPAIGLVLGACGGSSGPATTTPGTSTAVSGASTPGEWASGGTDLITAAYPDTSIFGSLQPCSLSLTESTTEGPCYFSTDTGEDISLGEQGLPMQLCLQLLDTDCNPLADRVIEVWHCDTDGIYSGDTSASEDADRFAGDFCTGGEEEAEASTFFRGQRTTDTDGRVNFKTCFPGWYSSRAIHIHIAVSDQDGTTRAISQLGFADNFTVELCTSHDRYADRGSPDTSLSDDTVFPAEDNDHFLFATEQNADGSLLAYAVLRIDPEATAQSGGGAPDGPGGGDGDRPEPPGDGDRPEPPSE